MAIEKNFVRRIDWRRLMPVMVVCASMLAYANSFSGVFLLDDTATIVNSREVRDLWPPWKAVRLPARWLTDITFAVNYAIDGLNPAWYHAFNLAVHLLAGMLLYGVVRRTLAAGRLGERYGAVSHFLAGTAASAWVAHPLQTESVTYICQRFESMMGLFYLLMLYCFIRAVSSARPRWWFVASVAAWVAGTGTKSVIATAPFVIMAYDLSFVSTSFRDMLRRRWQYYAAIIATFIPPLVILAKMFVRGVNWDVPLVAPVSSLAYLLTQAQVILHYLRLSFAPYPLVFDYRWPLVSSVAEAAVPSAVVIALVAATAWGLFRRRAIAFPGVWFFLILAPTSSIMPLNDVAAEHRMYLPLAGVLVLVVVAAYEGLAALSRRASFARHTAAIRVFGAVACVAAVLLLAGMTAMRNRNYASRERMWADVAKRRPDNWRAHFQLCAALYDEGKYDAVVKHCEALLKRLPSFGTMTIEEVVKRGEEPGGEEFLCQSDAYARAQDSLGCVAQATGDARKAVGYFREAVRLGGGDWNRHVNLGVALFSLGVTDEAVEEWTIASKLPRHDGSPYQYLGIASEKMGDLEQAIKFYDKALWYQPDGVQVCGRLARLLATCPDARLRNGPRAVKLAESACRSTEYGSCELMDLLAAAHAESGHFEQAVEYQQRALTMLRQAIAAGNAPAEVGSEYEYRLTLYLRREPYRSGVATNAVP